MTCNDGILLRCCQRASWVVACLLLAGVAHAQEGRFEVTRAEIRLEDNRWLLDGRVDLELSAEAVEALESGVMLTIELEFEVTRQRLFWTDEFITTQRRDYELQYMALSQRYLLKNISTAEHESYATLFSALRNMGRIRDWQVLDNDRLNDSDTYWCGLRAVLNQERLPGPLQMLAFWRGDFSLESDWYRWKLR